MLWHLGGGGKGQDLDSIVPALSEIITGGKLVSTEPDKMWRPEVKSVHKIMARVMLDGVAKDVIATIREADEGTFHYDHGRNMSDGARSMLSGSGKATVRVGDAQVLGPALEVGPVNLNLEFEPVGGNAFSRGRISVVWSAPIEWSNVNVSAWSASGLSGRCFWALEDGILERCAV